MVETQNMRQLLRVDVMMDETGHQPGALCDYTVNDANELMTACIVAASAAIGLVIRTTMDSGTGRQPADKDLAEVQRLLRRMGVKQRLVEDMGEFKQ